MKRLALLAAILAPSAVFAQGSPGDPLPTKVSELVSLQVDIAAAGSPANSQQITDRMLANFYANMARSQIAIAQTDNNWSPYSVAITRILNSHRLKITSEPIYNSLHVGRYFLQRSNGSPATLNPYRIEEVLPLIP